MWNERNFGRWRWRSNFNIQISIWILAPSGASELRVVVWLGIFVEEIIEFDLQLIIFFSISMWTLFLWEKNGFKSNVSAIFVEIHRIPLLNKPIFPHFVWFLENNETRFMNLIAWVELTLLRTSVSLLLTIYTEIDREIVVDSVLIYTPLPPSTPHFSSPSF